MEAERIVDFLAWCLVLDLGLLLGWFLSFALAHDWMYRIHGKWFKLSVEKFDSIHYAGLAGFKIGILLLNLVPYLVLRVFV